jgi:hypothetical protein
MNERIRELAFEANKDLDGNVPIGFAEKFAELIVRECVKAADEWYQYHNEIQWDPGEHIKQHFGVEE